MGLTIHYHLKTHLTEPGDVRTLVESLRQFARELPFKKVGGLLEFQGTDADYEQGGRESEDRWFKIEAGSYLERGNEHYAVKPSHIIGFSTWPGEGCEAANFGFCQYPMSIDVPSATGRKRKLATGLEGWSWSSFCKTQYASSPQCGGIENFLRCHICVIRMLDFMKTTGLVTVEVNDEGDYWDHRNLGKLASEVGDWNQFIAAFAGQLKDQAGREGIQLESIITGFANFEHLEAKGLERLRKLRGLSDNDA
jgi:hypothetical protein